MAESTEECKSLETITRKVKSEGKSNILKIQIEDQDSNITTVIVKKNMTMQKIMNAFYNRRGVDPAAFRVLHDGNSFALEHTPEELGITEEDVISIFLHQEAGGYSTFGYKS